MNKLYSHILQVTDVGDAPGPVKALVDHIVASADQQSGVKAIMLYGSGLWKDASDSELIWDLHVLVDSFQSFRPSSFLSMAGNILPPNVFYTEITRNDKIVRCKFNIMRLDQFDRFCRGKAMTPQVWARFVQPCRLVYAQSDTVRDQCIQAITNAHDVFFLSGLGFADTPDDPQNVWVKTLEQTYADELRSEGKVRASEIYAAQSAEYDKRYALWKEARDSRLPQSKFWRYALRPVRKLVAFLRLMKATFTFENGVDYALWKVERHSGVKVQATEFQRKYPLIGAWPLVWKLYRKGAFR